MRSFIRPSLLALFVLPSLAFGQAAKMSSFEKAEEAYDDLEYDQAAALYEQALKEPGTRQERIGAYKGQALSFAILGQERDAKEAFRRWLALDPAGKINVKLGPKVVKPFEAAKRSLGNKRAKLELTQDLESGALTVQLYESLPMSSDVAIAWRPAGAKDFKIEKGGVEAPFTAKPPPDKDLEVFAYSLDPDRGVLHEEGTREKPIKFKAVKAPAVASATTKGKGQNPKAVEVAVEDARRERDIKPADEVAVEETIEPASEGGISWPVVVGVGVGVLGAGVAGVMLSRPPALALPAADRTVALP